MSLEKMECGVNYTTEVLKDNVNGLIDGAISRGDSNPVRLNRRELMITASISTDSNPTITTPTIVPWNGYTKFELKGSRQEYLSLLAGYYISKSPSGSTVASVRSFYYSGNSFEVLFRYSQGYATILIDDVVSCEISLQNAVNQPRYFKVTTGNTLLKKITVISAYELFGGFAIEPASVMYPTRTKTQSIGVIGDSITSGTGSSFLSYPMVVAASLRAYDVGAYGIGGSGYINNTGDGKFINRIGEVASSGRDILMVAGGINDLAASTVSEFSTAVDAFYESALNYWSGANIIIISNWSNGGTVDGSKTTQFRDVLKAKAEQIGARFIDAIGDSSTSWLTGAGKVGSVTGVGNCDIMITSDGTHPTQSGHNLYGVNIARELCNQKPIL